MKQQKPSVQKLVYAVDIDGVLCVDKDYGSYETRNLYADPIISNIAACRSLYDLGHTIILHTSRPEEDRAATEYWLKKHGVLYHAMVMGKLKANWYIDDKNNSLETVDN